MTRANESNLIFIWGLKKKRDWIVGRILCTSTKDEKTTAISQGLTGFLKRGRKWDRTGIKRNVSRRLRYIQRENVFDYKNLMIGDHQFLWKCLLANWKSSKLGELRLLRECISFSRALLFIYLFFLLEGYLLFEQVSVIPILVVIKLGGKKESKVFISQEISIKKIANLITERLRQLFEIVLTFPPSQIPVKLLWGYLSYCIP